MRTKAEIETAFSPKSRLDGHTSFFLVGIGGAGMAGVARMLHAKGFQVKGTDSTDSATVHSLRELGIEVTIGHSGSGLEPGMALVLSDAIPLDGPESVRGVELGLDRFRRSQVLGWLLGDKKVIAVTGTHGKTTTTGMLAAGLIAAGHDPTVVVGAEVPQFGGSVVIGQGEYAVVEACEAYDSLHDFDPFAAILTNLEHDHVDFHPTFADLQKSVWQFLSSVPKESVIVYDRDDPGACDLISRGGLAGVGSSANDLQSLAGTTNTSLKGRYNHANAAAALTLLQRLGCLDDRAKGAVLAFIGSERRQQVIFDGELGDPPRRVVVIDDYAHHPTEVAASLQAIREGWITNGTQKRLVVVFQPHLYSRTAPLIDDFAKALSIADFVVVTDIYPAREEPLPGVSSLRIVEKITKPVLYVPSRHLLARTVMEHIEPFDVVVGMGAGNISEFPNALVGEIRRGTEQFSVAVIYGGDSPEREVSIHSARAVKAALDRLGLRNEMIDVSEILLSGKSLAKLTGPERPDVAFLAVHGSNAEDGAIQGLMELLHIKYTGSNVQGSATAIDKALTKSVYRQHGIPCSEDWLVRRGKPLPKVPFPAVVKPNKQGSTVGLSFVNNQRELEEAVEKALMYDKWVLIEPKLVGTEISVPVLLNEAAPAVEIVPDSGSYDFASKYVPGTTREICPARISDKVAKQAAEYAVRAHIALGCSGVTRTDFIVTKKGPLALETNTLPGMTPTSLVPLSAATAGIDFDALVNMIVKHALIKII